MCIVDIADDPIAADTTAVGEILTAHRLGLPAERAAAEIIAGAGTQFCPRVVAAFKSLFARGRFHLQEAEVLMSAEFKAITAA